MKTKTFHSILCTAILLAVTPKVIAQTDQDVTATILHLDSAFWNAYNNCDTAHFKDFFSDDVEFYHDKGGITLGASALIESLDKNICGNDDSHLRREAVAGTVKVYPLKDGDKIYGAVISGEHKFYVTPTGKPEFQSGIASFTELWQLKNGVWKMTRVLSYNHHEPDYVNRRKEIIVPAKQLERLIGTYKSEKFGTVTLVREGNILLLKMDKNTFTIYPMTDTTFFSKERDLTFEFVRGANEKPVKMIVKENGAVADELLFVK